MKILLIFSLIWFLIASASVSKYRLACKLIGEDISQEKIIIGKALEYLSMALSIVSLIYILNIDWFWCILISIVANMIFSSLYVSISIKSIKEKIAIYGVILQTDLYIGRGIVCFVIGVINLLLGIFIF